MNILDVLLDSDPAVKRQTEIYLLDRQSTYTVHGWLGNFLLHFDTETKTWGNGIYGPKWISTFYTMRDLTSLEIDPHHSIYQQGLSTLVFRLWRSNLSVKDDVCVVAMLVSMLSYGNYSPAVIDDMVNYLLKSQLSDGGWNCAATRGSSNKSSIHTTLSVLEAYADYEKHGYTNLLAAIRVQTPHGQAYLLERNLMRRKSNDEIILPSIVQFHFPTRWKYDVLRALSYFAAIDYPYEPSFSEGLALLKKKFERGYLSKGPTYSGRLHFQMETTKIGTMNTLRGLRVLKRYDADFFNEVIRRELAKKLS